MSAVDGDWLVVIDAQRAFAEPDGPWYTPGFDTMAEGVTALVPRFGDRIAFTRFVPPAQPAGSWRDYYRRWTFASTPAAAPQWELVPPWTGRPTVDRPTFSKWDGLAATAGAAPAVVLAGVSTDCCVLATALAAVDDGAHVRVVTDACAAQPTLHAAALAVLARRAPQVVLSTVAEEIEHDQRRNR